VGQEIGRVPSINEFSSQFDHVKLTDKDFTTRNFAPGSGGQSAFYKVLTGDMESSELYEDNPSPSPIPRQSGETAGEN
jgi:hypothetical protein